MYFFRYSSEHNFIYENLHSHIQLFLNNPPYLYAAYSKRKKFKITNIKMSKTYKKLL